MGEHMAERMELNFGWEFTERFDEAFARGEAAETQTVDLPHSTKEVPFHYFDESLYQMDCGYRKRITVPASWAGRRVFLCVGAAGHFAQVFLNGKLLGEHRNGYTAFKTELTGLAPGEEALLALRVDSRETLDQPPFGYVIDYMTFGGLYREVWLEAAGPCFIEELFPRPSLPEELSLTGRETPGEIAALRFTGELAVDVRLSEKAPVGSLFRLRVLDPEGDAALAEAEVCSAGEDFSMDFPVPDVGLWDVESPRLYRLEAALWEGDRLLDRRELRFGFRRSEFRGEGYYLNGRRLRIRGLNRHQSYPYAGYAMPAAVQRFDADILKKELGLNAVRTSHYPQSQHFIDRCDELGLLVFTEIPGWQHIGGEQWKEQAVKNVEEMVLQYRHHPSVILWGVRINESVDDDALYARTNALARELDPTRPTGGVRCYKKGSFLEDVYTYNDFVHSGANRGCTPKKDVTPDPAKPYMVTEYNGHMYPTKSFDDEEHRQNQALRHAAVLDAVAAGEGIAGSFGWCLFDYNTHKDFGSGDRICYHGVLDMFRNPKVAAAVYASQGEAAPVLELSSAMDLGERAAGNRGRVFLFTNADTVRMYKNDRLLREYDHSGSPWPHLDKPPIEVDDFVGRLLEEEEGFPPKQAELVRAILNHAARFGSEKLPPRILLKAGWLMLRYRMRFQDAYRLYGKYVGSWGKEATVYRFDAVKDGEVVASVTKTPFTALSLRAESPRRRLTEAATYDAEPVRLSMRDQNGNLLPFYGGWVRFRTEGPIALIGPAETVLRGGLGGTYVRTVGESGPAALTVEAEGAAPARLEWTVEKR